MARRGPKPKPPHINADREKVLALVAAGYTNPQIAHEMGRPKHWVADQLKTVYRVLGVHSRAQAVLAAVGAGILAHPATRKGDRP